MCKTKKISMPFFVLPVLLFLLLGACGPGTRGAEAAPYTVTFNSSGGGTLLPMNNVPHGTTIVAPATPTPPPGNAKSFMGWYKESGFTNRWNFTTDTVTSDLTLYAKWDGPFTVYITRGRDTHKFANAGERVYIEAYSRRYWGYDDYRYFEKWVSHTPGVSFGNHKKRETYFTMPASDVSIEARYERDYWGWGGSGGCNAGGGMPLLGVVAAIALFYRSKGRR